MLPPGAFSANSVNSSLASSTCRSSSNRPATSFRRATCSGGRGLGISDLSNLTASSFWRDRSSSRALIPIVTGESGLSCWSLLSQGLISPGVLPWRKSICRYVAKRGTSLALRASRSTMRSWHWLHRFVLS